MSALRCPACGKDTTLWEGVKVTAWVALNADGTCGDQREVDPWSPRDAQRDGTAGCGECGWEGPRSTLEATP